MKSFLLDTNIIVRFLVGDQKAQKKEAVDTLKQAESGKIELILTAVVLAETSFVLQSFYKLQRRQIVTALEGFSNERWIKVPEREILQNVWPNFLKGFHFVDSYLYAWSLVNKVELFTFDKDLQKLKRK